MILKPRGISPNNISIDTSNNINISWKNSGDRQYAYQVVIQNNSDNTLAYNSTKLTSFNTFNIITSNTLNNGVQYKMQITNWNQLDEFATSDWVLFKCSSTPTVALTNLLEGGTILNNSYLFQGEYNQLEVVAIKSWQFILYDSLNTLISTSPETFNSTIEYEFAGLNNNTIYKIELQVKSQDNLLGTTGKISFFVQYEVPKSAIVLEATNNTELGAIQLQWNVTQIIGSGDNYTFIDNEKVDVVNGNVLFDEGFMIPNNFTNELWIEGITNVNYNINPNTTIVISSTPPVDTTVIWVEDINQVTPLIIGNVLSPISPINTSTLWIEDVNQIIATHLINSMDIITPMNTATYWVDLNDINSNNTELYTMVNDVGDIISLRYHNNGFHIYENDVLIDSVLVTANTYYIYIQQINGALSLHAESND